MYRENLQCFFQSWPGLTSKLVHKYLQKSLAIVKGYLNQSKKNAISTLVPITMYPSNTETHLEFSTAVGAVKVYSYQTGHLPVTSSRVVNYIFILYSYDANENFQRPSGTELEMTSYMLTPHVMTTSRKGYLIKNIFGWIVKHPIP